LGHAHIEYPFLGRKGVESLLGDGVLVIPWVKMDPVDTLGIDKGVDRLDEPSAHGRHEHRRGHRIATMLLEEIGCATTGLQYRLVGIQIQTVDPFDIQHHMLLQQFPDGLFYHCSRPRLTLGLRVPTPPGGYIR